MKDLLGEFEHQVLLAVLRLGTNTYSVPIVLELEERTGREPAPAAVYIALRRLEEKGFVESDMRRVAEASGGRSRRYFSVTEPGTELLRASRKQLAKLWEGLDPVLGDGR